jgi:hypothetical protein
MTALADFAATLVLLLGGAILIGTVAHALGWFLARRATAEFVWRTWNLFGVGLLLVGIVGMAYAWAALGLQSGTGSLLLGLGLLLASAGIWMLVPI